MTLPFGVTLLALSARLGRQKHEMEGERAQERELVTQSC